MKKSSEKKPRTKIRSNVLLVRLGLRETDYFLTSFELATLLEQLYTFKTLEDIALRDDRAGAFERTMLRHK